MLTYGEKIVRIPFRRYPGIDHQRPSCLLKRLYQLWILRNLRLVPLTISIEAGEKSSRLVRWYLVIEHRHPSDPLRRKNHPLVEQGFPQSAEPVAIVLVVLGLHIGLGLH